MLLISLILSTLVALANDCENLLSSQNNQPFLSFINDSLRSLKKSSISYRCFKTTGLNGTNFIAERNNLYLDHDLFLEEKVNFKDNLIPIAIFDTGINTYKLSRWFHRLPKALDYEGKETSDFEEHGHGVRMASLISGNESVGLFPEAALISYKLSGVKNTETVSPQSTIDKERENRQKKMDPRKTVDTQVLFKTLYDACKSGVKVLNVSLAAYNDHIFFEKNDELKKVLIENGCLLIKGAGNTEETQLTENYDINDAIVRVAALDISTQKLAKNFPSGEYIAPGIDIKVIDPGTILDPRKNPYVSSSGSSISTAIVSALMGRTYSQLNQVDQFKSLPNNLKIELLNKLLKLSSPGNVINSYLLYMNTKSWITTNSTSVSSSQIQSFLPDYRSMDICSNEVESCFIDDCNIQTKCVSNLRKRFLLCGKVNEKNVLELITLFYQNNQKQMAEIATKYFNSNLSEITLQMIKDYL